MKEPRRYDNEAREFCAAIRELGASPAALDNLESYLTIHFKNWLKTWAATPEGIADEMRRFSEIR